MSERGVFAVDRGIWDHLSFADEPLTEREAWMWLIGAAAFKPHRRRIGSVAVELDPGQLAASTRFMAGKWGWSEPRVRRFLKHLKADAMIDTARSYRRNDLQLQEISEVSLPSNATYDAQSDAAATQDRRKIENKENNEVISVPNGTGDAAPIYTDSRHGGRLTVAWKHSPQAIGPAAKASANYAGQILEC